MSAYQPYGFRRPVLSFSVRNGRGGGLYVTRTLSCGHVSEKRFTAMDKLWYATERNPFRKPRYAWCLICAAEELAARKCSVCGRPGGRPDGNQECFDCAVP